tara:strand:- start:226 stop:876 length:651 start_codon:yes stop_codon:yes gene_type:complete
MLKFIDCSINIGGRDCLKRINLTIGPRSLSVIQGESQSGKTLLLKLAAGIMQCTSGKITFNGTDLASLTEKNRQAHLKEIGMIESSPQVIKRLTVFENIALPLALHSKYDRYSRDKISEIMKKLFIFHKRNTPVKYLTQSEKQVVTMARCIIKQPSLVLCDNILNSFSSARVESIKAELIKLLKSGTSILIVSPKTNVLSHPAHHIIRLWRGELLE